MPQKNPFSGLYAHTGYVKAFVSLLNNSQTEVILRALYDKPQSIEELRIATRIELNLLKKTMSKLKGRFIIPETVEIEEGKKVVQYHVTASAIQIATLFSQIK